MSDTKTIGQRPTALDETKSVETVLGMSEAWAELRSIGTRLSSDLKRAAGQQKETDKALEKAELDIAGIAVSSFNKMIKAVDPDLGHLSLLALAPETEQLRKTDSTTLWSCYMGVSRDEGTIETDMVSLYERVREAHMDSPVACIVKVQFCLTLHELVHAARSRIGTATNSSETFYANEALSTFIHTMVLEYLYSDVKNDVERRKAFSLVNEANLANVEFNTKVHKLYSTGDLETLVDEGRKALYRLECNIEPGIDYYERKVNGRINGTGFAKAIDSLELGIDSGMSVPEIYAKLNEAAVEVNVASNAAEVLELMKKKFIADGYLLPEHVMYIAYLFYGGDALAVIRKGLQIIDNSQLEKFGEEVLERLVRLT